MMAQARSTGPGSTLHQIPMSADWHILIARFLGRSSRWATDEADHFVRVAREVIVGSTRAPPAPDRKMRPGAPVPVLVDELTELVARSDCRSLERDQRFWCLVRELYSRRPWSPRKSPKMVDTVGVEVKESQAKVGASNDAERTAK